MGVQSEPGPHPRVRSWPEDPKAFHTMPFRPKPRRRRSRCPRAKGRSVSRPPQITLPDHRPRAVARTGSARRPRRCLRGRRGGRFGLWPRGAGGRCSACGGGTSRPCSRRCGVGCMPEGVRPRTSPRRRARPPPPKGRRDPVRAAEDLRPRTRVYGWVPSRDGSVLSGPRVVQHPGAPEGMPGRSGRYGTWQIPKEMARAGWLRLIKSASREPTSGLRMLRVRDAPATEAAGSSWARSCKDVNPPPIEQGHRFPNRGTSDSQEYVCT